MGSGLGNGSGRLCGRGDRVIRAPAKVGGRAPQRERPPGVHPGTTTLFSPHTPTAMILDSLFGTDDNQDQDLASRDIAKNEQQEKEKDYKKDQSNGKESNDPSAARYTGAHGYTQRDDQKDQLDNLHIGGSEATPQGGTDHQTAGEQQQGPGFKDEGSYELDYKLRTYEQKFGEETPSGPAGTAQDG